MNDPIVAQYERAISGAAASGDNDKALELSIWFKQYKEMYK